MNDEIVAAARRVFENAQRVCVLTGAGISAESGVPTFRGGGNSLVWRGHPFEALSSAQMVRDNLALVWEWFDYRREVVGACHPNDGHMALARAQKAGMFDDFSLITQNIDGLHDLAGSTRAIELHGNIWRARCGSCQNSDDIRTMGAKRPPDCRNCGGRMRPDVVLFGEYLDAAKISEAERLAARADVCLVVGTSALVYPAADLPRITKRNGGSVIEVNPEVTVLTDICDVSIRAASASALPELFG